MDKKSIDNTPITDIVIKLLEVLESDMMMYTKECIPKKHIKKYFDNLKKFYKKV